MMTAPALALALVVVAGTAVAIDPPPAHSGATDDVSVYTGKVEEEEVVEEPRGFSEDREPEQQIIEGINDLPSVVTDVIPEPVNNSGWEQQRLKQVLDAMLDKESLGSKTGNGCGQNKSVVFKDVKMTIDSSGVKPDPPHKTPDQVDAQFQRFQLMSEPATPDAIEACGKFSSCNTCLGNEPGNSGCGWCASLKSCLPGKLEGPVGGSNCTHWDYSWCSGEPCNIYRNCYQCVQDPFCGWCGDTYTCSEGTAAGPLFSTCKSWDAFAVGPGEQCGLERELGHMETNLEAEFAPSGVMEYGGL